MCDKGGGVNYNFFFSTKNTFTLLLSLLSFFLSLLPPFFPSCKFVVLVGGDKLQKKIAVNFVSDAKMMKFLFLVYPPQTTNFFGVDLVCDVKITIFFVVNPSSSPKLQCSARNFSNRGLASHHKGSSFGRPMKNVQRE